MSLNLLVLRDLEELPLLKILRLFNFQALVQNLFWLVSKIEGLSFGIRPSIYVISEGLNKNAKLGLLADHIKILYYILSGFRITTRLSLDCNRLQVTFVTIFIRISDSQTNITYLLIQHVTLFVWINYFTQPDILSFVKTKTSETNHYLGPVNKQHL